LSLPLGEVFLRESVMNASSPLRPVIHRRKMVNCLFVSFVPDGQSISVNGLVPEYSSPLRKTVPLHDRVPCLSSSPVAPTSASPPPFPLGLPVVQRSPLLSPVPSSQRPPRVRRQKWFTSPWPPGARELEGRPEEKSFPLLLRTAVSLI
jgi:hypothetical protein